jgi:hypothetical protein
MTAANISDHFSSFSEVLKTLRGRGTVINIGRKKSNSKKQS